MDKQANMGKEMVRTVGLSSSPAGRFLRGERENGHAIILRGVPETWSSGISSGESSCCPGVGREKMRWKEDGRGLGDVLEKTAVFSTNDCEEGTALAMSRDSLTRWLNSFMERVSFRVLVMEGDGGRKE